ncbi:MAG: NUDIX domain-containing protein [Candidatus Moranbacteria bacterium]|nr:NUDIX domain-containing protein [Candidatus Moranbacteria bacterium]
MRPGIDYTGICVCWFCHDGQGNFVMQKRGKNCRDEQGKWDTGGGTLEFADEVEKRLQQEIGEELGVRILEAEFLGFRNVYRSINNKKTHWLGLDFKVLVNPQVVSNKEPHKFDEIGWFTLKTLPKKLHSQLPKFFEKYKKKLN